MQYVNLSILVLIARIIFKLVLGAILLVAINAIPALNGMWLNNPITKAGGAVIAMLFLIDIATTLVNNTHEAKHIEKHIQAEMARREIAAEKTRLHDRLESAEQALKEAKEELRALRRPNNASSQQENVSS